VFFDEVFQQTQIQKCTSEYMDERSRKTNVSLFLLFTYKKNFRLGFLKLDMRFPHVLMEHKSSPLLILHRKRISGLGVGLKQ